MWRGRYNLLLMLHNFLAIDRDGSREKLKKEKLIMNKQLIE